MAQMFAANRGLRTIAVGDKSLGADGLACEWSIVQLFCTNDTLCMVWDPKI